MNDLTGHRYGRLTVTGTSRPGVRQVYAGGKSWHTGRQWLCVCDCGVEIWVPGKYLRGHSRQSCGCLRRDNGRAYLKRFGVPAPLKRASGEAARQALWGAWSRAATKRGYKWALTFEQFCDLTSRPCWYCGCPPSQSYHGKSAFNGAYVHSGLDRQANNLGYTLENTVSCCQPCNFMKRSSTVEEFLAHVRRICLHQEAVNVPAA